MQLNAFLPNFSAVMEPFGWTISTYRRPEIARMVAWLTKKQTEESLEGFVDESKGIVTLACVQSLVQIRSTGDL
jgi:hypothetical protein